MPGGMSRGARNESFTQIKCSEELNNSDKPALVSLGRVYYMYLFATVAAVWIPYLPQYSEESHLF